MKHVFDKSTDDAAVFLACLIIGVLVVIPAVWLMAEAGVLL